jgi:outer membrane receptor protein involved in Fe transport
VATDADGQFSLESIAGDSTEVIVAAPGFAPQRFDWHRGDSPRTVRLSLPAVEQRVTVADQAATRTVSHLDRTELETAAAPDLDTSLRQLPGFSLFRRTPSWSANPTTQGVSLRGSGASGASRAAVLLDGIPVNDPFGGWVYWGRVTPDTIEAATVTEGGVSELYGTQAMGGVVELARLTRPPGRLIATTYLGNLLTPGGSVVANQEFGRWWTGGAISFFRTNGYVPTAPDERGAVDTVANSENGSGWLRLERDLATGGRVFLAGDLYGESRQNGTYLQFNSATIRELRIGADLSSRIGEFSGRVYGGSESLRQTFSAITPDRSSESLTRDQSVPVAQWGVSGTWSKNMGSRQMLMAGTDGGWIEADDEEWVFVHGVRTGRTFSGGSEWRAAGFVQDQVRLTARTMVTAGIRVDHWVNQDARSAAVPLDSTTPVIRTDYPDRSDTFVSPRVGLDFAATNNVVLHASVSRAFRAPTLNELYRSFRVGNILTLANANLGSEEQTGTEAGATITLAGGHSLRGTFFWSGVSNPVSNVTLSTTPVLITRQRDNLGSLRSTGVEFSWEARWNQWISTAAAYQYANSIVTEFPADPTLIGLWIPQVARHNATAQVRFGRAERFTVVLGGRYQGLQYDDDRNQFPLGGYFVADAYVARNLHRNVVVFAAGENLFDRRYEVGRTPTTSIGPPILVRLGFRFSLGGN